MQPQWLYLIGQYGESVPSTHINCSADPFAALEAHNAGRERETRKAAGRWQLLLLICVPPTRELDTQRLVEYWRRQRRTIQHRLIFGIRMAAKLMLLCFASAKPLRDAKAGVTERDVRPLLDKVLAQLERQNAPDVLDRNFIQDRVDRYLQKPSIVYAQRRGDTPLLSTDGALTDEFLNEINTIKKAGDSQCFSRRVSGSKRYAGEVEDEEEHEEEEEEGEEEEQEEDEVPKKTRRGAGTAKRAKKLMTIVNGLVGLQQSAAFNDLASAVDAQLALAQTASAPAPPPSAPGTARRRQRGALFGGQGGVDSRTLRQYGDALCVDMGSSHTLANMKVIDGQNDRRCVCGTQRPTQVAPIDIVLMPQAKPLAAYRCTACGRFSATYERYCIDSERATRIFKPNAPASAATDDASSSASSADSLDLFVQTLLVSFNDGAGAPAPVQQRTPTSRARRRLYGITPAEVVAAAQPVEENKIMYGNRAVVCRHASLTALDVPHEDDTLIQSMFMPTVQ